MRFPALLKFGWMLVAVGLASCGTRQEPQVIVVKAPVTGEVRRVLATEGTAISQNAVILEMAPVSSAPPGISSAPPARRPAIAPAEVAAAEREVNRAASEVSRLESLVASNRAPQAQLDAARADLQRAQERLQQARIQARAQQITTAPPPATETTPASERIVPVLAPAAGTLSVISVRPGQKIRASQPVATISVAER